MTTIHQLKPITVQDEDGNDVTIEYSTYIINLERSLLGLKKGDAKMSDKSKKHFRSLR